MKKLMLLFLMLFSAVSFTQAQTEKSNRKSQMEYIEIA